MSAKPQFVPILFILNSPKSIT